MDFLYNEVWGDEADFTDLYTILKANHQYGNQMGDVALGFSGHMMSQLLVGPLAVDHEHAAGLDILDHLHAQVDVSGVVAGHEVSLVDVVGAADVLVAETQMADGHAAGLLGVILEVCLNILVGMVADDLDGVLVSTDRCV